MRRTFAPYAIWTSVFALAACAEERADVGLALRLTAGLLSDATSMELRVSEGSGCDPTTGSVTGETSPETFSLERCGDQSGAWCKTIKLDKDDSTRVFHVVAVKGNEAFAEGCTTASLNQDPLEIDIQIKPLISKGCCNDGIIQSTEQCDTGLAASTDCAGNPPSNGNNACLSILPDEVCECDCLAKEVVLSVPGSAPNTTNDPGTKSELSLAFVGTTALRAVYTDSQGLGAAPDINIRSLTADFTAIEDPAPLAKQLRLPALCTTLLTNGIAREQRAASIAQISAKTTAIVFADSKVQPQKFNISLSVLSEAGCAESEPVKVNVVDPATCSNSEQCNGFPDVAGGPSGSALVVWNQAGQLRGRIWKEGGALVPAAEELELGPLAVGTKPHVAGSALGWVVVYTSAEGDNISLKRVDASGGVIDSQPKLNVATDGIQDQPDVAMTADGRSIVVWRSEDAIYFQRFDAMGQVVGNDQGSPLSRRAPSAAAAALPAVAGDGEWFVAAWAANDGTVWARYVGTAGGFGFNNVNGLNDDFLASHPGISHERLAPAVAVGKHVAIGWQDPNDGEPRGMIVRRFPLPRKN